MQAFLEIGFRKINWQNLLQGKGEYFLCNIFFAKSLFFLFDVEKRLYFRTLHLDLTGHLKCFLFYTFFGQILELRTVIELFRFAMFR